MIEDVIYRNQLGITIIAFPMLFLFAVILVILQPAFPYTLEGE